MSNSLTVSKVTVRYGRKIALSTVSLDLACGKIHALLGENGAGKSSLLRAIAGVTPAAGRISFTGQPRKKGLMRQDAGMVAGMSVIENLALAAGAESWRINWQDFRRRAQQALASQGVEVDLDCDVRKLGFGQRQKVGLAGLDLSGCEFLLLDEPVAGLTPVEADAFLAGMRRRVDRGASALIASHRIEEILAVADCVHVLRDGRLVISRAASQVDPEEIRQAIFARRKPAADLPRRPAAADTVLAIEKLALPGSAGHISMRIAAGEAVGIAGMAGNGQNEFMEVLAGFRRVAGTIRIGDRLLSQANGRRLGIRCIMEDPLADACMPAMTIAENLIVHDYGRPPYSGRFSFLQSRVIADHAAGVIARARLAVRRSSDPFCWLSGGNQRKLLVERELAGNPVVVAAHNPTAGLDSASVAAVVASLARACERGAAVLLFSEDLEILSGCSDRLMVMVNGSLLEVSGSDRRQAAAEIMCGKFPVQRFQV